MDCQTYWNRLRAKGFYLFFVAIVSQPAFSTEQPLKSEQESICTPFINAANDRGEISKDIFELIFSRFVSPVKAKLSTGNAVRLYLNTYTNNLRIIEWGTWQNIRKTIHNIYTGKVDANQFYIYFNNTPVMVTEYRAHYPIVRWHYYDFINKDELFYPKFIYRSNLPGVVIGELGLFDGKLYLFLIPPPFINNQSSRFLYPDESNFYPGVGNIASRKWVAYRLSRPTCRLKIIQG